MLRRHSLLWRLALLLMVTVGLGIIARTVPQMNVFIVGFPLSITIGLLGIGLSLPLFGVVLRGLFETCSRDIVFLINRIG
jgi:flagellar biosynthetic protein FliR